MNNAPRRRGRPPVAIARGDIEQGDVLARNEDDTVSAAPRKRRRRADVNGMKTKLAAPTREGFMRRWFNDTPGRLAEADELAYSHVTDSSIKSDGTDSRVRRLVGTQANGQPLYAYLMETPVEEYQVGLHEREEIHKAVDTAINEGRDSTGRIQDEYGEGSIKAG